MSNIKNIKSYHISSDDNFFFDNNIWMFLFCPTVTHIKKQKQYSSFFSSAISSKACIWINSLVLSEFCNSWLRIEFNKWKKLPANLTRCDYKKDFVKSSKYNDTILEIQEIIPEILKYSERGSDNFNAIEIENVINELSECDFNDSYYLELARKNNYKIVTDDADFFKNNSMNIEIITGNISIV